jgi:hypothetical protein
MSTVTVAGSRASPMEEADDNDHGRDHHHGSMRCFVPEALAAAITTVHPRCARADGGSGPFGTVHDASAINGHLDTHDR